MTSDSRIVQEAIPNRGQLRLRLPPLTLTAIWASTALSVDVRQPDLGEALWRHGTGDFLLNLVLYVPVGIILCRYGCLISGLAAAGLSILIECVQLFYPDRFTTSADVVANTLGAVVGCLIFGQVSHHTRRILESIELTRRVGGFLLGVGLVFLVLVSFPRGPSDFRNWDPECRLLLGDELTGDRRFRGTVSKTVILRTCLDAELVSRLSEENASALFVSGRLAEDVIYTCESVGEFERVRGKPLLEGAHQKEFFDTLVQTGTLTLLVWFRTDDLLQSGPTRIVSYSKSPRRQNFVLGQEGRNLVFRVLTPTTAPSGFTPQLETQRVLVDGRDTFVAATYDGRNARVYLDGRRIERLNLRAHGRLSPFLADSGLPAVSALAGMLVSLGVFGISVWFFGHRWLVGALVGFNTGVIFLLMGGADALTEFSVWIPVLGLWGGVVAASSIRRAPGTENALGGCEIAPSIGN
ncbi:MAG: VanZ family protein [Candidatus Latescibacterota bacterium]|nr:MAG: VanZ family protein [Candidatus Latescibacterota bacterium]